MSFLPWLFHDFSKIRFHRWDLRIYLCRRPYSVSLCLFQIAMQPAFLCEVVLYCLCYVFEQLMSLSFYYLGYHREWNSSSISKKIPGTYFLLLVSTASFSLWLPSLLIFSRCSQSASLLGNRRYSPCSLLPFRLWIFYGFFPVQIRRRSVCITENSLNFSFLFFQHLTSPFTQQLEKIPSFRQEFIIFVKNSYIVG